MAEARPRVTLETLREALLSLLDQVDKVIDMHIELIRITDLHRVAKACEKNVSTLVEAYLYVQRCVLNLEKKLKAASPLT